MIKSLIPDWFHIPHREDNLFSIVFLIVLVIPTIFIPALLEGYESVKYVSLLILVGIGLLIWLKSATLFVNKTLYRILLAWVVLNTLSVVASLDKINSIIGHQGRYTGSTFFVVAFVLSIMLFVQIVQHSESRRLTILRLLVFVGLLTSIVAILHSYDIFYYRGIDPEVRSLIPSLAGNQNFYAMFLVAVIPAAVVLWQVSQRKYARWYYAVSSVIILFAMVLSGSRGALLGLAGMGLMFVGLASYRRYDKKVWLGMILLVGIAVMFYFGFFNTNRADYLNGTSANASYTAQSRLIVWKNSLSLIKDRPLLGTGTGNFQIVYGALGGANQANLERFDDAHNLFLNVAVTEGIPAAILLLFLLAWVWWISVKRSVDQSYSALWIFSSLAGVGIAANFTPVSIPNWLLVAMFAGFAGSFAVKEVRAKRWWKYCAAVIGVILIIFGACFLTASALSTLSYQSYWSDNDGQSADYAKWSLRFNPYDPIAKVYSVAANLNLGKDPSQEADDIKRLATYRTGTADSYQTAGILYYRLYTRTKDTKYIAGMNDYFAKALTSEPDSPAVLSATAFGYYYTAQTDKALRNLEQLMTLPHGKDNINNSMLLAKLYADAGQKDQTTAAVKQVLAIDPNQLLFRIYLMLLDGGKDTKAIPFPAVFSEYDIH
jgi:O-antigen ligase